KVRQDAGTLSSRLLQVAAAFPEREALVCGEVRLTFADLSRRIVRLSARLTMHGLRPGDHTAVVLPNGSAFVESLFAASLAGGVVVPIDPRLSDAERQRALADPPPALVISSAVLVDDEDDTYDRVTAAPSSASPAIVLHTS